MKNLFSIAIQNYDCHPGVNRTYLSLCDDRTRSSAFPVASQRQPGERRKRPSGWLRVDRTGICQPGLLSTPAIGGGEKGYDATASSGSNLGPTSKKLQDRINDDLKRLKEENPDAAGPVPAELVTASGSGLDPHLSPEGMLWQVPRVAKARGVAAERVKAVVESNVEGERSASWANPGSMCCWSTWRSIGSSAKRLRCRRLRKRKIQRRQQQKARPRLRRRETLTRGVIPGGPIHEES